MSTITTRILGSTAKNAPLTNQEIDNNFININTDKVETADAVSTNTVNKVVKRDASGNFSAGTISAALSGNSSTSSVASNLAGGSIGTIPYNTASNVTTQLAAGANGSVLRSNGGAAPTWLAQSSMSVGYASSAGDSTNFAGATQNKISMGLKAGHNVSGGGTIAVTSNTVKWSARYIVIANGNGSNFGTDGYFDITCPTSGTVTGVGGAASVTANANGIPLAGWTAIYYILPIGSTGTSIASNFRVMSYTAAQEVPYNWILICNRNDDNSTYHFPNGISLLNSQNTTEAQNTENFTKNSLGVGTPASGTAGQIRASNNITAYYSSDKNLKENIVNIDNPLDKIKQLNGVTFDWKQSYIDENGGEDDYFMRRHDIGVIAQEVESVIPEIVGTREDGTKAVKYDRIVAVLIEAMKEQQTTIDELQCEVNKLKDK